jgi:hypothetical protein
MALAESYTIDFVLPKEKALAHAFVTPLFLRVNRCFCRDGCIQRLRADVNAKGCAERSISRATTTHCDIGATPSASRVASRIRDRAGRIHL